MNFAIKLCNLRTMFYHEIHVAKRCCLRGVHLAPECIDVMSVRIVTVSNDVLPVLGHFDLPFLFHRIEKSEPLIRFFQMRILARWRLGSAVGMHSWNLELLRHGKHQAKKVAPVVFYRRVRVVTVMQRSC